MSRRTWKWAILCAAMLLVLAVFWQAPVAPRRADSFRNGATQETPEEIAAQPADRRGEREAGVSFQVRDLANGHPVVGIRIRARDGSDVATAETDQDGTVALPVTKSARLEVDDPRWSPAPPSKHNNPFETGTYWVHGWIKIDGVVRVKGDPSAFNANKVRIHVLMDGRNALPGLPEPRVRAHVVKSVRGPGWGPPSADGRFRVTIPRVYGVTVVASARGWKPASQRIDVSNDIESAYAELWLRRAVRVSGSLRSSDGRPLHRVPVYVHSLVRIPANQVLSGNLRLLAPDGGVTGSVDLKTGEARAKFISRGKTDREGKFDLWIAVDGDLVLIAYVFDHKPVEADLGRIGGDVADLNLVAERIWNPSLLRVVANGKALPGKKVFVADLSLKDGHAQPGVYLKTDDESRIPTDWLVPDRRYYFRVDSFSGHMVWDGRKVLDVGKHLRPVSELPSR